MELNFNTEDLSAQQAAQTRAIVSLDLELIKFKITNKEDGKGWPQEQAEETERLYRGFLFLHVKHPGKSIVPSKLIDEFWHQHILDTRKYAEDSHRIFGKFLHHFPYFGMRGEEDAANLKRSFAESVKLFREELGIDLTAAAECSECDSSACDSQPACGSSCTGESN